MKGSFMSKKIVGPLIMSFVLLSYATTVIACSCGCKGSNCASTTEQTTSDTQEQTVQCPVMKTWILPSEAADSTEYNSKTYYFCCGGCKEQFLKNPDTYINDETKS